MGTLRDELARIVAKLGSEPTTAEEREESAADSTVTVRTVTVGGTIERVLAIQPGDLIVLRMPLADLAEDSTEVERLEQLGGYIQDKGGLLLVLPSEVEIEALSYEAAARWLAELTELAQRLIDARAPCKSKVWS